MKDSEFKCSTCLQSHPVQSSGGTGYALFYDRKICYSCADILDRARLLIKDHLTAYVSCDGKALTTWSGGKLGRVDFGEKHPWSPSRHYISVVDIHGQRWFGTGGKGEYTNLKKNAKGQ